MEKAQLGLPVGGDATVIIDQETVINKEDKCISKTRLSLNLVDYTSIDKYIDEWKLLWRQDSDMKELRERALAGDLRACRVRSVCWRVLLGVLPAGNPECWQEETRDSRKSYQRILSSCHTDPHVGRSWSLDDDNPLSQHTDSPWNQYFLDRDLENLIQQDVIRTFPGVDFFRDELIQAAMINILFCYARLHPDICYRQGMHEILAPLIFVIHCDNQVFEHAQVKVDQGPGEFREMWKLIEPTFLEADSFWLFEKLMSAITDSYRIENVTPSSTGYFPAFIGAEKANHVLKQLNRIKHDILAEAEPDILDHLERLDIPLPLFGIRWLRLLFGREFPLQDLLVLWDAIFADGPKCELVNYLVVSMLSAIKDQLLSCDYTASMSLLMRYPANLDISNIIDHALYLKDPKAKEQPGGQLAQAPTGGKKVNQSAGNAVAKSSALEVHTDNIMNRYKWLPVKRTSVSDTRYGDTSSIIDGFVFDDPGVARTELKHCRALMALVKLKLAQYHQVLDQCIPPSNMPAQQALTGIHELCSLLDPHHVSRSPTLSVEIEPAFEAGETTSTTSKLPPPKTDVDMTTFKETLGQPIDGPDSFLLSVKR